MKTKKILKLVTKLADEKKGENITILDVQGISTLTDYFIIISATSIPHLRSLAKEIAFKLKKDAKLLPLFPYNVNDDKWILIDYSDFIVHIFLPEVREFYNLENLWYEAKRIKINLNE